VAAGSESIARLYTRAGDRGDTGLVGGARLSKDSARVRAYGTLDEFEALLGLALVELPPDEADVRPTLRRLQHEAFVAMSELATPPTASAPAHRVEARHVARMEKEIDAWMKEFDPVHTFVLPGGGRAGAILHLARTVMRRAEREVITLHRAEPVRPELLQWMNRVSDLLFAAALLVNRRAGQPETPPDYRV
jgi:cob(I)alamin adenosyltransferase